MSPASEVHSRWNAGYQQGPWMGQTPWGNPSSALRTGSNCESPSRSTILVAWGNNHEVFTRAEINAWHYATGYNFLSPKASDL